jgi:hypothetical protein
LLAESEAPAKGTRTTDRSCSRRRQRAAARRGHTPFPPTTCSSARPAPPPLPVKGRSSAWPALLSNRSSSPPNWRFLPSNRALAPPNQRTVLLNRSFPPLKSSRASSPLPLLRRSLLLPEAARAPRPPVGRCSSRRGRGAPLSPARISKPLSMDHGCDEVRCVVLVHE